MSKKEIYAWSSLASSIILLGFYLVTAFGWPEQLESHGDYITGIFWKLLGIAVGIEIILELMREFKIGEVHEEERDILIESKGYRNAYYFFDDCHYFIASQLFSK